MALRKMILILAFAVLPFLGISQDDRPHNVLIESNRTEQVLEFSPHDVMTIDKSKVEILGLKRIERISEDPFEQSKSMHYSKSRAIISVKSLMRILHPKRKETVRS